VWCFPAVPLGGHRHLCHAEERPVSGQDGLIALD
jgi:hypothetical protein